MRRDRLVLASSCGRMLASAHIPPSWAPRPTSHPQHRNMSWLLEPPTRAVLRRRDEFGDPFDHRRLRRQQDAGTIVRIAPGAYLSSALWMPLSPIARHAQRVWEAAGRVEPGAVFSHGSAAALRGIDTLGDWPDVVEISVDPSTGGRSSGVLHRYPRDLGAVEVTPWGDHFVTTAAQTVADIAAARPFAEGVAAADQALWTRRAGGPLAQVDDLRRVANDYPRRGAGQVRRVVEFARPGADSVRESHSRVLIVHFGFPEPELQHRFVLPSGRTAYSDFWWPDHEHAGEFDGLGKYLDPRLLKGRSPRQALVEEKDREDELRRMVRAFSRWRVPELEQPRRLYRILSDAGLPSSRRGL